MLNILPEPLGQDKMEITTEEVEEWIILDEYDEYRKGEYKPISLEKFLIKKLMEAKKALEIPKYTEEDLIKAISFGQGMDLWREEDQVEKFIQSLNETKQQEP